jgi:alkylhydroperoxidase/carboxymuconolactone decarboxylase family protein YurZ
VSSLRSTRTGSIPNPPDLTTTNMNDMDTQELARPARPARAGKKATGNWNPDWEPFAKLDPAWTEKVIAMAIAPAVAGALDAKTIELIGIALDAACTHMYAPGVRRHIQRALKAGATKEEITAVLQLATLQGLHSMCLGAPILLEELEAQTQRQA